MKKITHLTIIALIIILYHAAAGHILSVPDEYRTIQEALDASAEGDTVMVGPGEFSGGGNCDINLGAGNVVILSEYGPDSTFIDCLDSASGSRAFIVEGAQDSTTVISGFTIINSSVGIWLDASPTICNDRFEGNRHGLTAISGFPRLCSLTARQNEYGLTIDFDASVSIRESILESNTGCGISMKESSSALFENCSIDSNAVGMLLENDAVAQLDSCRFRANDTGLFVINPGGALGLLDSVRFSNNHIAVIGESQLYGSVVDSGQVGFLAFFPDHIHIESSRLERIDSLVLGSFYGIPMNLRAGIDRTYRQGEPGLSLDNCVIENNPGEIIRAQGGPDGDLIKVHLDSCTLLDNGGGIDVNPGVLSMNYCLYAFNGGPIEITVDEFASLPQFIENCDIIFNEGNGLVVNAFSYLPEIVSRNIIAGNGGTGLTYVLDGPVDTVITCNDVFSNAAGGYSGIDDQTGLNGNISADPWFCLAGEGGFGLFSTSPCAPENNSCGTLMGVYPVDCYPPEIDSIRIDTTGDNQHVISEFPQIQWHYTDSSGNYQTEFEIKVGLDDEWTVAELWDPPIFQSEDTLVIYDGNPLDDGQTYFLRLKILNGVVWSGWHEISFRTNTPPSVPLQLSPPESSIVQNIPAFWVMNSSDAENDSLTYEFSVRNDSVHGDITIISGVDVPQGTDSSGWQPGTALEENWKYWWSAGAFDGYENSLSTGEIPFWVNDVQEPPFGFNLVYPPDMPDSIIHDMTPTLTWEAAPDPDPLDSVFYSLLLSTDSTFLAPARYDSIYDSQLSVPDSLDFSTEYWWRVWAFDVLGDSTVCTETFHFRTWRLGDINNDWKIDILDVVYLINFKFKSGPAPKPYYIGDLNGDCTINILDMVYLINHIYKGGPGAKPGCEPD